MKIFAASIIAAHHETKETYHELFTFSPKDAELTPEQRAMEIARELLPQGELFDCQLKVIPVDLAKHYQAAEFHVESSKEV